MAAAATRSGTRPDLTGFAVAIVAHAVLLWVLLREQVETPPDEPAAMEVSFVEEVGPVSSSPVTAAEPAPTFGEEISPETASGADASTPAPVTPPVPEPVRPPVETGERRRPDVTQNRVPVRPATPPRVTERQPQRPQPRTPPRPNSRPGPSGPSFADVARRVGGGAPSRTPGPAASAPAQLSGAERRQIVNRIGGLIQPCANRARAPNGFARSISVVLQVTVARDGSPTGYRLVSSAGADGPAGEYVDDVEAVAMRAVRACASRIATLPAPQYENGWRTFRYQFRFP